MLMNVSPAVSLYFLLCADPAADGSLPDGPAPSLEACGVSMSDGPAPSLGGR